MAPATRSSKWGFSGHLTCRPHDTKILSLSISATAATLVVPSHYLCQYSMYMLILYITRKVLSIATDLSASPLRNTQWLDRYSLFGTRGKSRGEKDKGLSPSICAWLPCNQVHLVAKSNGYRCLSLAPHKYWAISKIWLIWCERRVERRERRGTFSTNFPLIPIQPSVSGS